MDKKSTLDALLSGKLEVKDALGKITTRDLAESLFDYTKQLVGYADSKVISILSSSTTRSENEGILVGIFYRIYLWMKSLIALDNNSHIQGVAVALRSLFELFLDLKFLANYKKGECFEKYIAFSEIEMFKEGTKKVQFFEQNFPQKIEKYFLQKQFITNPERINRITSNLKKFWAIDDIRDLGKIQHWSKKKVRDRAAELGIEYEEIYIEFYSRLSSIVHGSGLEFFRKLNKEHFESYFSFCHQTAQRIFIEAMKNIASIMGIDKAWEHEEFYKKLDELKKENLWKFLLYKLEQSENPVK